MNSKTLRRLAADHSALRNQPLPPNYLFLPTNTSSLDSDDLTQLDILLAGPTHTPFSSGVWKLHLTIPPTYPQAPPTANFRTPIFHPNVDSQTGGVCVETLKRDWEARLTLRDVLVTISCLLIQPNPDSALNAEAGALIQEDYAAFARRAELMTSIHAVVPRDWRQAVLEAQKRGHEEDADGSDDEGEAEEEAAEEPAAPARRRRLTTRIRGMAASAASRRSDGSPGAAAARRRMPMTGTSGDVVVSTDFDDLFNPRRDGQHLQQDPPAALPEDDDSGMIDADQENDESRSPTKPQSPVKTTTPRRPLGAPIPLGELAVPEPPIEDSDDDDDLEPEYPPSPRKSPSKSPMKRRNHLFPPDQQPGTANPQVESSRAADARARNVTPLANLITHPLAEDSPFVVGSASPRKTRREKAAAATTTPPKASLFSSGAAAGFHTPLKFGGVSKRRKSKSPKSNSPPLTATASSVVSEEVRRKAELDERLWGLCGGDVRRWNRGQFDGDVLKVKARRW